MKKIACQNTYSATSAVPQTTAGRHR